MSDGRKLVYGALRVQGSLLRDCGQSRVASLAARVDWPAVGGHRSMANESGEAEIVVPFDGLVLAPAVGALVASTAGDHCEIPGSAVARLRQPSTRREGLDRHPPGSQPRALAALRG